MRDHYDFSVSTPAGVARIDLFKRVNVTSPLECTIDELLKRRREIAETALGRPSEKNTFGYGRMCGLYQAYGEALSLIEKILNEGPSSRTSREES